MHERLMATKLKNPSTFVYYCNACDFACIVMINGYFFVLLYRRISVQIYTYNEAERMGDLPEQAGSDSLGLLSYSERGEVR